MIFFGFRGGLGFGFPAVADLNLNFLSYEISGNDYGKKQDKQSRFLHVTNCMYPINMPFSWFAPSLTFF
jgi:hypothetical protein